MSKSFMRFFGKWFLRGAIFVTSFILFYEFVFIESSGFNWLDPELYFPPDTATGTEGSTAALLNEIQQTIEWEAAWQKRQETLENYEREF